MYLQNPFVLIGIGGIVYYLFQRKKLALAQEEWAKTVAENKKKNERDSDGLLLSFKGDIAKMSDEELFKTIKENEEDLLKIKDDKQKQELAKMIEFCANSYNERQKSKKQNKNRR